MKMASLDGNCGVLMDAAHGKLPKQRFARQSASRV
jgi:hypothetical protein